MRVRKRRARSSLARKEMLTAYAFVAPQVVGLLVFMVGPLLLSLYYSFTKWDLIAPSPTWVGTENWEHLPDDPRIPKVLWNTTRFILTGTTSYLVLALLVALLVNRAGRGFGAYRAAFVLPFVLATVSVGTSWRWVLDAQAGPVAQGLGVVGVTSPQWLFEPAWAMIAIAMATTWQFLGFGMTIYLARLRDIPRELYEAAAVDGARAWQRFRHITWPQLSAVTFFLIVTSLIGALQLYDPVVAMTTDGFGNAAMAGGPQDSTRTVLLYLYNQMFQYNERISGMGYAAVIAWLLVAITLLITGIQFLVSRRWVFYQGGVER